MTVADLHAGAIRLADARQPEVVRRVLKRLLSSSESDAPVQQPPAPTNLPLSLTSYSQLCLALCKARQALTYAHAELEEDSEYSEEVAAAIARHQCADELVKSLSAALNTLHTRLIHAGHPTRTLAGIAEEANKTMKRGQSARFTPRSYVVPVTATSGAVTATAFERYLYSA